MLGFECEPRSASGEREHHIVLVIGHTMNSDLWLPEAQRGYFDPVPLLDESQVVITNTAWVDYFIVHDTNYGMYLNLSPASLSLTGPGGRVLTNVLCFLPGDIKCPFPNAKKMAEWFHWFVVDSYESLLEGVGITLGGRARLWMNEARDSLQNVLRAPVFRILLVRKEAYLSHLSETLDRQGVGLDLESHNRLRELPDLFWLIEATLPDLYSVNRSKLADIVIPATVAPIDPEATGHVDPELPDPTGTVSLVLDSVRSMAYARFPGFQIFKNPEEPQGLDIEAAPSPIEDHMPLFEDPSSPRDIPRW
ncbi:unnamed protein product [marine sediment metagenome]|uniref:Uncharacterized protein n=1 Tax=marine sediment metagenome TaxID=412755 RepID=X1GVE0_9ZZZZ